MRTFDRLSSTAPLAWWRSGVDRFRRAMMARSPAIRASLILALVLGLVAVAYWATMALVPTGTRYLASGRLFSSDDLTRIRQAFDEKGIPYRVEDRKIEIAADQYDQAVAEFAKLHVGSPSFEEIRSPTDWLKGIVETQQDKERNERLRQERFIERCLNGLDGIVLSRVSIRWPRPTGPHHLRGKPSAFINLETEPNRPLPLRTQQAILTILISNEPELSDQSITIMDLHGNAIFDPRNPSLTNFSRDQAREEEVRKEILEKLSYIKGVNVWVRLTGHHDATAMPVPAAAPAREPTRAERVPPVIGVNQPIELDEPAPKTAVAAHPTPPAPAALTEHGQVLVNVPRSFYYNHMLPTADQREPTPEVLRETAARTKELIIRLVKMEVPESWTVDVDTFPDDGPLGRPAVLPDARRKATDWGIVAAVAAAIALLTALASWIQVVRRPARIPEMEVRTRRYRADSADEPSPSERVRELVRRDPEAAASVLQRWTTQGGRVS
jgi:flagellar M-ring protein FliF